MDESAEIWASKLTSKRVRVLMVHGTWARGLFCETPFRAEAPRWFEPGSKFQHKIEASLTGLGLEPIVVEHVTWTAKNSIFDRGKAAQELVRRLNEMPLDEPCLVITHSYGGNVVLRALEDIPDEHVARLHVVTMATPFVEVFLPLDGTSNYERMQLAGLLLCASVGLASYAVALIIEGTMAGWLLALPSVAGMMFGRMMFVVFIPEESTRLQHRWPCLAVDLYNAAKFQRFRRRPPHLLILRGVEDEAALLISAAGAFGRIAQLIRDLLLAAWHNKLRSVIAAGIALLVSILVLLGYGLAAGPGGQIDQDVIGAIRLGGIITSAVIVVLPLTLIAIGVAARCVAGAAAGRELARIPHLEVSVSTAPDFNALAAAQQRRVIWVRTIPRGGRQAKFIRHSIYDEPDLVEDAIQPWLKVVLEPKRKPQPKSSEQH